MSEAPIMLHVAAVTNITEELAAFRMEADDPDRLRDLRWVPGQVGVLATEDGQKGYFAIASAPEEREALEFLVKRGKGVSAALFGQGVGGRVAMTGPIGKGFPIDNYRGRDLLLMAVGTAMAPLRAVIRSILKRRDEFGQIVVIYGVRHPSHFAYQDEIDGWRAGGMKVILTCSQPGDSNWPGATGYVQAQLEDAREHMHNPVALICGMKEMMDQAAEALRQRMPDIEVLTNY